MGKAGWITLGVFLLIVIVVGGVLFGTSVYSSKTLTKIISDLNYRELSPPSNLYDPGTVILVIRSDPPPYVAQIVCRSGDVIGNMPIPRSATTSQNWQSEVKAIVSLGANELKVLNAKAVGNLIENVQASFANASVSEIADTMVIEAARTKRVTSDCLTAIEDRIAAGDIITMISSALHADVTYKIAFSSGLKADAKAQLAQAVAGDLGATVSNAVSGTLTGQGLNFGIRSDPVLVEELLGKVAPIQPKAAEARKTLAQLIASLAGTALIQSRVAIIPTEASR